MRLAELPGLHQVDELRADRLKLAAEPVFDRHLHQLGRGRTRLLGQLVALFGKVMPEVAERRDLAVSVVLAEDENVGVPVTVREDGGPGEVLGAGHPLHAEAFVKELA